MKIVDKAEAYADLANAIVAQAAEDYREVLKLLKEYPKDRVLIGKRISLEHFFLGQWCERLTKVSGDYIMLRIKHEVMG